VDLRCVVGLVFVFDAVVDVEALVLVCFALPFALGADSDGPALVVRLGGLNGRRGRFCAGLGSPGILLS
jgi:hypothetical protein